VSGTVGAVVAFAIFQFPGIVERVQG
jgi:hypothetical protein